MGQTFRVDTGAPAQVELDAYATSATVQNLGPDAVYYRAGTTASSALNDGTLASGGTLTIRTSTAFVAQSSSARLYQQDVLGGAAGAEQTANKGQPNGYAALDSSGHVLAAVLPSASTTVVGAAQVTPPPNISTPVAFGANAQPIVLAQNGPWPLPPAAPVNADAQMTSAPLVGGLAASATVQTSPKDCSSVDYVYVYRVLFVGTAAASLVVSSSPDTVTWTNVSGTLNAAAEGSVFVIRYEVIAAQAYMRTVLTNGVGAQGASAKLVDGVELLVAA